jgi:hypothetical protein
MRRSGPLSRGFSVRGECSSRRRARLAVLAALARIRCSQVDSTDNADRSVLIASGMI